MTQKLSNATKAPVYALISHQLHPQQEAIATRPPARRVELVRAEVEQKTRGAE